MRRLIGRFGRMALALAIMSLAASGALAADDDDLKEPASIVPDQNQPTANVSDAAASIDRFVYGRENEQAERPEQTLESLLRKKVDVLARAAGASGEQQRKLLLAGQGDIRRFIDRVDDFKETCKSSPFEPNGWQQIRQHVEPLQHEFRGGLFAGDSLFAKLLSKMLTAEQAARCARFERDRRLFQHRAGVQMTVLRLSTALGLSDEQRTRLEQLLLKETRPARSIGRAYPAVFFNIVFVQMGRLPEKKLKPLFEPWQWRVLQTKLESVPGFAAGLQA
ncbi:MAG TPA: hypothetical protein VMR25_00435, partial [Planctomycetaceae bacterium]|nr:hypothetical protein [Planctomycetaceae bacterium]